MGVQIFYIQIAFSGVSWSSGLVRRICVLMAESSECEFESWLRPWCLCPWARHFTIIASLHPGEMGTCEGRVGCCVSYSPMRRNGSNWAVYSQRAEMVSSVKCSVKCLSHDTMPCSWSGVWFHKSEKSWVCLWYRGQRPPEPPGCLILEDLQTLHIPINKGLEVWTQYRLLLSFLGGYFSSFKKILRQREIFKNPEIRKSPEKSHACIVRACILSYSRLAHL